MSMPLSRSQVAASAVLGFSSACVAHELLGHGAACLLEGGLIARLSSVYFQCSGGGLLAGLGGPLASALLGLACLAALALLGLGHGYERPQSVPTTLGKPASATATLST